MNGKIDSKEITPRQVARKALALAVSLLLLILVMVLPLGKIDLIRKPFIYAAIIISTAVAALAVIFHRREFPVKTVRLYYHFADFLLTLNIILVTVQLFFLFLYFPATVDKTSMYPNLENGDRVIVRSRVQPQRFDVVVLKIDGKVNKLTLGIADGELLIKRVIGMPGDEFYYEDGYLHLNGELVPEPYLTDTDGNFLTSGSLYNTYTQDFDLSQYATIGDKAVCVPDQACRIPEGYYFVLGDNRAYSIDSRNLGLFHKSQIVGVARYRIKTLFDWEKI
ncbi:MAG TPA: signal peptidase I [Acholeplasmataceae bacterium]|nr:signal peptidase I [Acholeplasmataceae bacterium]